MSRSNASKPAGSRALITASSSALVLAVAMICAPAAAQTAPSVAGAVGGQAPAPGVAAPVPPSSPALAPDAAVPPQTTPSDDIVVTGSLISSPNKVAASPITSLSIAAIKETGQIALQDVLNQQPQFTPAGTAGNGGQGAGGHATINLHGLGTNRNLVLLDGRRLPLATVTGDVDINLVPENILGGLDVITGGASAVYGSDAMSGVVNFQTLKKLDGLIADVQYGNSFHADYPTFNGSLAFGTSFRDDRGHLLVSGGYTSDGALRGTDRSFFNLVAPSSFIGQSTFVPSAGNLPSQATVNAVFASYGVTTPVANTLNLGFNDNGTLFTQTGARNYQGPTTGLYAIIGNNVRMPVVLQQIILNPLKRYNLFSKVDFKIADGLTFYGQAMYVDSTVTTSSGKSLTQFGTLTTIPVTNPFIPADLRTILASRPNPTAAFGWNTRYVGLPAKEWDEKFRTFQFLGGLKGRLPLRDWTWDVYASYDQTDHDQLNYNAVLKSQVQNLLSAADGGRSLCAGGFDPFGLANATNISPACAAYMTTTAKSYERLGQTVVQGVVQGPLFSLPAGPVKLAVLGDYRRNTYSYSPDSQLAAQNVEAVVASQSTSGSIDVKEIAGQLDVPVLADKPFFHLLSLGGAYRYSDYNISGSVSSYEGDVRWFVTPSLLLRGGYQRAVRAPNVGELFSAASGSQINLGTPPSAVGDPCDVRSAARTGPNGANVRGLCSALGVPAAFLDSYQFPTTAVSGVTSGNQALRPEVADTYNLGAVWTPHATSPFLRHLSISVDYYNIAIGRAISVLQGLTAISKCFNLDGSNPSYAATNSFCQLTSRDANGQLLQVSTPYLNLGGIRTDGIDVQFNWRLDLRDGGIGAPGEVFLSSGIGYLRHFDVQTLPNTPFVDYADTNTQVGAVPAGPHPRWKAVTSIGYTLNGSTIGLRWHYLDAMRDVSVITSPATPSVGVPVYQTFDLFGSYALSRVVQLRAGINNLFDRSLPYVASSQTTTDTATYDVVGRAFYVGARASF